MKKPHHILAAAILLLTASPQPTHAFDKLGHKTIAAIAWERLTPAARTKTTAIFAADLRHRTFIAAAVWPDEIKPPFNINNTNPPGKAPINRPWHYVDIPYTATTAQITATIEKPGTLVDPAHANSANVVTAIRYYTATLKSGQGTPTQQADALSWLLHLVGDIHQPLHTVQVEAPLPNYTPPAEGDGGGNGFQLDTPSSNLHHFWDHILDLTHDHATTDANARTVASALALQPKPTWWALTKTDPATWARESYAHRQFAYSLPAQHPNTPTALHPLTESYKTQARQTGETQIILAAHRLAKLLNSIY